MTKPSSTAFWSLNRLGGWWLFGEAQFSIFQQTCSGTSLGYNLLGIHLFKPYRQLSDFSTHQVPLLSCFCQVFPHGKMKLSKAKIKLQHPVHLKLNYLSLLPNLLFLLKKKICKQYYSFLADKTYNLKYLWTPSLLMLHMQPPVVFHSSISRRSFPFIFPPSSFLVQSSRRSQRRHYSLLT